MNTMQVFLKSEMMKIAVLLDLQFSFKKKLSCVIVRGAAKLVINVF